MHSESLQDTCKNLQDRAQSFSQTDFQFYLDIFGGMGNLGVSVLSGLFSQFGMVGAAIFLLAALSAWLLTSPLIPLSEGMCN